MVDGTQQVSQGHRKGKQPAKETQGISPGEKKRSAENDVSVKLEEMEIDDVSPNAGGIVNLSLIPVD